MKRKIFSKLLMGALLVASVSSFTSCKDYDDDINSLKESVAKAALQSNLDALTTQVNSIKTTADNALTTANAAATKSELSAAKTEALAEAAKGITNAATAQAAAEAANKLAEEAKKAAESIDLSPYATKEYVGEQAAEAMTKIQTALADYWTAAKIQEELAKVQAQVDKALTEEDIEELTNKVNNAIKGVEAIWNAVTSVSLYANLISNDGVIYFTSAGATPTVGSAINRFYTAVDTDGDGINEWYNFNAFNTDNFNQYPEYGRVNKEHKHYTRVKLDGDVATPTDATKGSTQKDGIFGNKDYFGAGAEYTASADKSATFVHESFIRRYSSIIVRVSPASADISTATLKFMDTKGEDLSSVIEFGKPEPYTPNDAMTRAGSKSGLWVIPYRMKDEIRPADFTAVSQNPWTNRDKVYSLAVNNSGAAADRFVVSEYDLTFTPSQYTPATSLETSTRIYHENWNWTTSDLIVNVKGRTTYGATTAKYDDYVWTTTTTNAVAKVKSDNSTTDADGSTIPDRTGLTAFAVLNGETFHVVAPGNVKYVYVIRDDKNANLTNDASEYNAWVSYQYEGLNTLVEGNAVNIKVTIPSTGLKGDEVCFRLFAVNHDGTLADPDGCPFTVFVGNEVRTSKVAGTFHATKATSLEKIFDVTENTIASAKTFSTTETVTLHNADWTQTNIATVTWLKADESVASNYSEVKKAKVTFDGTTELCYWTDNDTFTGTVELKSGTPATTDWYVEFSLKKELPTADDVKTLWSWKENQLKDGVWRAVMYPENANFGCNASTASTWQSHQNRAYKGMNNAVNGMVDATPAYIGPSSDAWTKAQVNGYFQYKFASSVFNSAKTAFSNTLTVKADDHAVVSISPYVNGYTVQLVDDNDNSHAKLKSLIDNTTTHASTIQYVFGKVSSEYYDEVLPAGTKSYKEYPVTVSSFSTIYTCAFDGVTAEVLPFSGGKKLNADGTQVINAGDQEWNYIFYNHVASKNFADGQIYSSSTDLSGNVMTDLSKATAATLIKLSSPYGAQFVPVNLGEYVKHLVGGSAGTTTANNTPNAKLLSVKADGSLGNEDYFTAAVDASGLITFTPKSTITDPGVDTPSMLVVSGKCAFGHDHSIQIPVTIKTTARP